MVKGNKLGMDLGTTNSVVATFDDNQNELEELRVGNSPNIPSVVREKKERRTGAIKMEFGTAAKQNAHLPGGKVFRDFKVLLTEEDDNRLTDRGYDRNDHSPREIAKKFLGYCLDMAKGRYGVDEIKEMVICAPEGWNSAKEICDGRPALRDICQELGVGDVRVVSEPAAAGAYFAYRYKERDHKPYDGRILIVDYGGGTLDITLLHVKSVQDGDRIKMELKVEERAGSGQHENEVGVAAVAYQEAVVRRAIENESLEFEKGKDFFDAVDHLETHLLTKQAEIEAIFREIGTREGNLADLDEEVLTDELPYQGEELMVTYADLLRAYNDTIRPELAKRLDEINTKMETAGIRHDPNAEDFHIELAGGFGNFYLVRDQVIRTYQGMNDVIEDAPARELAVARGAALLASDEVKLRSTAPYSIGINCVRNDGEKNKRFAFVLGQDIEYDEPYFQCAKDGNIMAISVHNADNLNFIVNYNSDMKATEIGYPQEEIKKKIIENIHDGECINIAFSLDRSEILSLHVQRCDYMNRPVEELRTIPLSGIKDLLENGERKGLYDA